MGYRPIVREAERVFSVPPEELWDALANTDRLNETIGMPHVVYGPLVVTADAFYREAAARLGGFLRLRWHEYPFEWVRHQRYSVVRLFQSGPLDVFHGGVEVLGDVSESRVRAFAEVTPRTAVGWIVARRLLAKGLCDVVGYCDRFVALRGSARAFTLPPPPRVNPTNHTVLDRLVATLRTAQIEESLLKRFVRHVTTASDAEVRRMQPFGLADGWGAERRELLRLLVQAERDGGLYHTWEVMCPNCRVATTRAASLAGVPGRFHCDTCGVAFDADLERWVELRYSVRNELRRTTDDVYCIGGPANTPHIWAQHYMLPATERVFSLVLPADEFRVRALRLGHTCPLNTDPAAGSQVTFTYRPDGWFEMRQHVRPGPITVRLRNEAPHVVVMVLERVQRDPRAITAAHVMRQAEYQEILRGDGRLDERHDTRREPVRREAN
jgi:hypothetical protein